jgi:hypothetical protein
MLLAAEVLTCGAQVNGPVTVTSIVCRHERNVQVGGRQSYAAPHASDHGSRSNESVLELEAGACNPESGLQLPLLELLGVQPRGSNLQSVPKQPTLPLLRL